MAVPTGRIWLCENVYINNSYEHTVDFTSADEQFTHWRSFAKYEFDDYMYVRRARQRLIVDASLDDLVAVNYLIFRNKTDSKIYYAFVTGKEYVSDKVTDIYFEIDVMQTYLFDYKILPSYVAREHTDRWDASHKPIYSRTAESLDYGTEYTVESAYKVVMPIQEQGLAFVDHKTNLHFFLVVFNKGGDTATNIYGTPTPYSLYLIPYLDTHDETSGQIFFNIIKDGVGETKLYGNMQDFVKAMQDSAIGDYIQQIIHLPYLPFRGVAYTTQGEGVHITINTTDAEFEAKAFGMTDNKLALKITEMKYPRRQLTPGEWVKDTVLASMPIFSGIENALPTEAQWQAIKSKPLTTERDKRFESKLLTHPYRYNMMTDFRGEPVIYKNEYIAGDNIILNCAVGIGFNSPYRYWLSNYRHDPEGRQNSLNQLLPLESTVLSDAYYSYMLQNKNQLSANITTSMISGASGVGQGLMSGGPLGALSGAISGAVNTANLVINQNAKQADIKNRPDTILNSNDCSMALVDDNTFVQFYRKKICCEFEELIADTFNISGYACQRVKVPNLKSRMRFNYIQTIGANIKGSFDQNDLLKIKSIFDRGVTFWHYSATDYNPLDYTYENIERSLV